MLSEVGPVPRAAGTRGSWDCVQQTSPLSLAEVTWVREVPRRRQAPLTCPPL